MKIKTGVDYNLFLDDYRIPLDAFQYMKMPIYNIVDWIIVRNYNEYIKCIEINGIPNIVSYDHDLSDFDYKRQNNIDYNDCIEKTGYHCAKWLIEYCIDNNLEIPKTILIHSMNVCGSQNIKSLFDSYNKSLKL